LVGGAASLATGNPTFFVTGSSAGYKLGKQFRN
jgi:hypothetical protein